MGRNNIDFLDATIVDVYKDTQAVIFMINPTAPKSLDYVRYKFWIPISFVMRQFIFIFIVNTTGPKLLRFHLTFLY